MDVQSSLSAVSWDPRATHRAEPARAGGLWARSALVEEVGSATLGEQVAGPLLGGAGSDLGLIVAFSAAPGPPLDVLDVVRREVGDVPVVGCSGPTVLSTDGPSDGGVALLALGGPSLRIGVRAAQAPEGRHREAARRAAVCIESVVTAAHTALVVMAAGVMADPRDVVRGAFEHTGASIPLVGGYAAAGPSGRWVSLDGTVIEHGVVAVGIGSTGPLGVTHTNGWRRLGAPMTVTTSDGTQIVSLDGVPALDRYLAAVGAPEPSSPEGWRRLFEAHPLGADHRRHEVVHVLVEADVELRTLRWRREVPAGDAVWAMAADPSTVVGSVDAAWDAVAEQLAPTDPLALLAFDCTGRAEVLGAEGRRREVARLAERSGAVPTAGVYTSGEFARRTGLVGYHNQTLALLALGEGG